MPTAMAEPIDSNRDPSADSRGQLLALVRGFRISQTIYVATKLGIPDLLVDGPRESDELARASGAHAPSLHRILLVLAGVGVLDKVGPRRFALAPLGFALRSGVPGSIRASVLFQLNESHWRPWGHLLHSVRTGETAFDHVHGSGLFDYLAAHPEVSALFNAGMAGNSPDHARLVAQSYDFSRMKIVVDVAGGRGRLLSTILAEHPQLSGILFDQPHVLPDARPLVAEAGVAERCQFVGGNFFESVPAGGDAYILRNIIHDWQDDQAAAILATCRRAMANSTRLLLVERAIADDPRAALPVLYADLEMLVNVGGRERTTDEYAALLARSGLRLVRTISLGRSEAAMGHYIVEAEPI
jgi:O-methyltransferase domain/Dimerisation domain